MGRVMPVAMASPGIRNWLFVLVLLSLSGCQSGEVNLAGDLQDGRVRIDAYPRPVAGAIPVEENEQSFANGCGIERMQGTATTELLADGGFAVDLPASLTGWAFAPPDVPGIPAAWLRLVPADPAVPAAQFPLVLHYPRPDVATAHAAPHAAFSGFTGVIVADIPPGSYNAQVVFATAAGRWVCGNSRRMVVR